MALIFPPGVLIYIFRSGKKGRLTWAVFVMGGMALALGSDVYLYQAHLEANKYSHLPPVVREMIALNEKVKDTTIALYHASAKLSSLGLVQSRATDMQNTLELIAQMRALIRIHQSSIDALVDYIEKHGEYIRREHLDWAFWIGEFYHAPIVTEHARSREQYFTAFEQMLQYTYTHYTQIMDEKSSQHRANYDAYYLRYRGVADQHNQINRQRIEYQKLFVAEHPQVKPFLPGTHHLEPFKFWDRFSF